MKTELSSGLIVWRCNVFQWSYTRCRK